MLHKVIYVLFSLVVGGILAFIITGVRRDVSLRTEFWWLLVEGVAAGLAVVLMAIDKDRLAQRNIQLLRNRRRP